MSPWKPARQTEAAGISAILFLAGNGRRENLLFSMISSHFTLLFCAA